MSNTTYFVRDQRGNTAATHDADGAERLSRAGYRVTAITEASR